MQRRYKRRLVLSAMAALVAVLAALQAVVYAFGSKDIRYQLEASAKSVAVSVAQMLMADVEEYRAFLGTMDPDSPYYRKMQRHLQVIREESGIVRYIYTERRLDENSTEYVLDSEPVGSDGHTPPGEPETSYPEKELVFLKGVCASDMTNDRWGRLITSYAPILAEDGEVLGLVGVDIECSHLDRQFGRMNLTIAASSLVIACLFLALLLAFSDAALDYMFKDRLTGAFTARQFERALEAGVSQAARHGRALALAMVEPDPIGAAEADRGLYDRVLAHIAKVVGGHTRPNDCLARYGDRGFALILADADSRDVGAVAEQVRRAVEEMPMPDLERGTFVKATVSVGATVGIGRSLRAEDMVQGAEAALAEARSKGNSVLVSGFWDVGGPA